MALDGDLQQSITLHDHPHSALGIMVCSFGLVSQLTDTLAQMRADGTLERIVGRYLENASQYLEVDTIGA